VRLGGDDASLADSRLMTDSTRTHASDHSQALSLYRPIPSLDENAWNMKPASKSIVNTGTISYAAIGIRQR
jgi:hypothetical protein